ncbi:selenocysteine-specific translation elongation factor [Oscillochloris trichoides DG-6]|uniref:Selenocysteine-specific elongation factor n=1 Tax=Oscillochloris trichoides DG-6 TaxID=765420 RepID=E1IHJ7_9CHLR|nr:selenocysteine-specific translation elongation factor [Oscillochloris trichoides]EFO79360.1 selenocysteine-specific translation elongation factor [Oscillochloris trichoides DG-6]
MYVIGTAGHVDHGKSTLVKALTGIDPDRLAEEQRREMTIDLGFAWLRLPSGRTVSLVDVPGHERFIKNMLAGVGGLDAALLIIAADEGFMPQTTEHLAILDLLQIQHGVVVLTKADLVEAEWLELVREDVASRLHGTSLAAAPVVAVSARTGQGLNELKTIIDQVLEATPTRGDARGVPRLPIDRTFSIEGFGTVVTGTLIDGPLTLGQEVVILPHGLPARIRGLQVHKQRGEMALPGSRVAVNLAGLHPSQIRRGDVLSLPGRYQPTQMLDLRLRTLADAPPIKQNDGLDLFVGAAEVRCRITLLDAEVLQPGAESWVQLRLDAPVVVTKGDRCILRVASPSLTVAGGQVVDPHPPRHRRFRAEVVAGLETLARGNPDELLLQALGAGPPREVADLLQELGMPESIGLPLVEDLVAQGRVQMLGSPPNAALVSPEGWGRLTERLAAPLRAYQRRYPLREGMPREEVRQRLRLTPRLLALCLEAAQQQGLLGWNETSVWIAGHRAEPDATTRRSLDAALAAMARSPYAPPTPDLDPELLAWALERGLLVRVAADLFFLPATYAELVAWVRATIISTGSVQVSQLRDQFGTTRRYALGLLEHLDERRVTRRVGEGRVLV